MKSAYSLISTFLVKKRPSRERASPLMSSHAARVQVPQDELEKITRERNLETQAAQGPNAVLNTWYRKWSGSSQPQRAQRSPFRCNLERDSGITRSRGPYVCLWFARGACYKGENCTYLHRAPVEADIMYIDGTKDVFGRTKFADYRDDFAGVGSLLHPNRTLFVGYFKSVPTGEIQRQFAEWGALQQVRVKKSFAFVTYKIELSAEFAKEAMANQTLTGEETLTVKWSNDDSGDSGVDKERIRKIVRRVLKERRTHRLAD